MKRALLAIAIAMFVIAGAAQPALAQQDDSDQATEEPENNSDAEEENETQEDEEIEESENETEEEEREEAENETSEEDNRSDQARGESAQFDARLGTAISTLDSLVEIAPNDEARNGLQNALGNLRDIQNNTDTASSAGPGERPEGPPERPDEAENKSEEETESHGPSQNSNRPEFVNQMLGGLFG